MTNAEKNLLINRVRQLLGQGYAKSQIIEVMHRAGFKKATIRNYVKALSDKPKNNEKGN